MKIKKSKKIKKEKLELNGWNTTDMEEVERRRFRGKTEKFRFKNLNPNEVYFSSFELHSKNDKKYHVEIRSLSDDINSCDCPDYNNNRLGTCKHIEHILFRLRKLGVRSFKDASSIGSSYIEIFFDTRNSKVSIQCPQKFNRIAYESIDPFFSTDRTLIGNPISFYSALNNIFSKNKKIMDKSVRKSRHLDHFIEYQQCIARRQHSREVYLNDVSLGKKTLEIAKYPLYPYQQEGMLHLAFNERALLADEMGLGKTVQAIAACELLRLNKNIKRVLVIATASLKTEWEEQISKFTNSPSLIIQGQRANRLKQYHQPSFFYLMNYEQVVIDGPEIQRILTPDVVILDEAQRIKNWQTKTANAIKQLRSPYAFVLTGTPLENRIDDLYSVVQFLDPQLFGPLFRFNRDFYELDEQGKPVGYKNLDILHQRVRPIMLRRLKSDVEGELPKRTVNNYFVEMESEQRARYQEYSDMVARLLSKAKRQPLRKEEFEKMQKWLACMRMLCDTPYILDHQCKVSPKLRELSNILGELLADKTTKIIIFSEWERMLQLVKEYLNKKHYDFAWHTGSVPQHKRREDINRFKNDPNCRLFLSTDSGSVGLNLQSANIVINLDLPWNPAKLEQRIARAWRKHQTRAVQVINLVCENSIEHRMLGLLAQKQNLAQGVLEGKDNLKEMKLPSGRAAFIERMENLMGSSSEVKKEHSFTTSESEKTNNTVDNFSSTLRNNVDLLQSYHHTNTGHRSLFAVVDKISNDIQKQLHQSFINESATIEILDRNTFEMMQRLEKAGIITINRPTEIYHKSDLFTKQNKHLHEKQMIQAKKHFSEAMRKQRMADVLLKSDFHEEAIAPLREALRSTIHSFAWLIGKAEKEDKAILSNHFIQKELVNLHGFPDSAIDLFNQLNDEQTQKDIKIDKLLSEHQKIIGHVDKKLNDVVL